MKVLVLGAGKMVEAILEGLVSSKFPIEWGIYSPSRTSAKELAARVGAQHVSNLDSFVPDWVIVGCKPQQLKQLAIDLNGRFKDALFLSLLAAIEEKTQREILGVSRLVRVMPNLSVKFKAGVTLLSSDSVTAELKEVEKLFSEIGLTKVMDEASLQELTLLTGSGPALFYEFTQNLAQSFTSLNELEREELARQVLIGSAYSVKNESVPLQQMIDAVTSRGGVTIAVLTEWRAKKLASTLKEGVKAGIYRTEELIKTILQN